jgi:hypothetical protein
MMSALKFRREMPIPGMPMSRSRRSASIPVLVAALLSAMAPVSAQESASARDRSATAAAGKAAARPAKKSLPIVQPEEKPEAPSVPAANAPADEAAGLFEEIEFGGTLVIEGKVEKPQVQFTLVKEPPPEKEIRFETSFLQSLLKQERENTFRP